MHSIRGEERYKESKTRVVWLVCWASASSQFSHGRIVASDLVVCRASISRGHLFRLSTIAVSLDEWGGVPDLSSKLPVLCPERNCVGDWEFLGECSIAARRIVKWQFVSRLLRSGFFPAALLFERRARALERGRMWRRGGALIVFAFLLQWEVAQAWNSAILIPPSGNSLHLIATASNAKELYKCSDGVWTANGGSADLLDPKSNNQIGNYVSVYDSVMQRSVGSWTLLNSPGDVSESGSPTSTVSGRPIATVTTSADGVQDVLSLSSSHQNLGAAALVSYIARRNTSGGLAPHPSSCLTEAETVQVPYFAYFNFYTQDSAPPYVPLSLDVPNGRMVEGFYAQGTMKYVYNGKRWMHRAVAARLYDVPGGTLVGRFSSLSRSRMKWQIFNPNGFSLMGHASTKSIQMSSNSIPWQLANVTSSAGNSSLLGPFKYVLMVSTRGGTAPNTEIGLPILGLVYNSPFSCIFWLFTTSG